jgi:hypothetical protein
VEKGEIKSGKPLLYAVERGFRGEVKAKLLLQNPNEVITNRAPCRMNLRTEMKG